MREQKMVSVEERVSYLEGKIDSLATKADLARLESHLESRLGQLESRLMRRLIMSQVLSLGAMTGIVAAFVTLLN